MDHSRTGAAIPAPFHIQPTLPPSAVLPVFEALAINVRLAQQGFCEGQESTCFAYLERVQRLVASLVEYREALNATSRVAAIQDTGRKRKAAPPDAPRSTEAASPPDAPGSTEAKSSPDHEARTSDREGPSPEQRRVLEALFLTWASMVCSDMSYVDDEGGDELPIHQSKRKEYTKPHPELGPPYQVFKFRIANCITSFQRYVQREWEEACARPASPPPPPPPSIPARPSRMTHPHPRLHPLPLERRGGYGAYDPLSPAFRALLAQPWLAIPAGIGTDAGFARPALSSLSLSSAGAEFGGQATAHHHLGPPDLGHPSSGITGHDHPRPPSASYPRPPLPCPGLVSHFLYHTPYISRYVFDKAAGTSRRFKSNGHFLWFLHARRRDPLPLARFGSEELPARAWEFRRFRPAIVGEEPPAKAYVGLPYHYAPKLFDPHVKVPQPRWSSPSLPPWLRWQDDVLIGVPTPDSRSAQVEVCAHHGGDDGGEPVTKRFWVQILAAPGDLR